MPRAQYLRSDHLSLAQEIRRYGSGRRPAAQRIRKRNCRAQENAARVDVGKSGAQRGQFKKVVSPAQKRQAVEHVVQQRLCSERRACRYLGLHRSTFRYQPKPPTPRQQQLHQRIIDLSWSYPRYGFRRIRACSLRRSGTSFDGRSNES